MSGPKIIVGGMADGALFEDRLEDVTNNQEQLKTWVEVAKHLQKLLMHGWGVVEMRQVAKDGKIFVELELEKDK
jgi:hypothetical protein